MQLVRVWYVKMADVEIPSAFSKLRKVGDDLVVINNWELSKIASFDQLLTIVHNLRIDSNFALPGIEGESYEKRFRWICLTYLSVYFGILYVAVAVIAVH